MKQYYLFIDEDDHHARISMTINGSVLIEFYHPNNEDFYGNLEIKRKEDLVDFANTLLSFLKDKDGEAGT